MQRLATAFTRTIPRTAATVRFYRPSPSLFNATSAASAPPDHSATQSQHPTGPKNGKGNTTAHTASASQHNAPKDPLKDKQEAEAAEAGPAVADGQYGPGNTVEGNYTQGTKQAQDRQAAAKQGEK
ncbi:hypothetical protein JCM10207_002597 [Rhodosporidiobolus poonsookiae]